MGIGHVAVGLGLKRADPQLNAGLLIFAALAADFLLGWFAILGWESYQVPPDYASKHYLLFTFPWSHGLLADLAWAGIFAALTAVYFRRWRAAVVALVAVFSHYILDAIAHVKGLPVAGAAPFGLGLGLWRNLPLELSLEVALAAVGLALYLRATGTYPRRRRIWVVVIYTGLTAAFLVTGQATATGTPPRAALIASWIAAPVAFGAIAWWLDRQPVPEV